MAGNDATLTPEKAAKDFESKYGSKEKDASSEAFKEAYAIMKGDDKDHTGMNAMNKELASANNQNPYLKDLQIVGFDDKNKELDVVDKSGNKFALSEDGSKKALWGADKDGNSRAFTMNSDGTVTYDVKKGDTMWSVGESLCREKHKNEPDYKGPTNKEIQAETKRLIEANKDLDPTKLREGKTILKLSKDTTDEIALKNDPKAVKEADRKDNLQETEKNEDFVKSHFDAIDTDKDGFISATEITTYADAQRENKLTDQQQSYLREIAGHEQEIASQHYDQGFLWLWNTDISKQDLNTWLEKHKAELKKPVEDKKPEVSKSTETDYPSYSKAKVGPVD